MKSKQLTLLLFCLVLILCVLLIRIYSDFLWRDKHSNKNAGEVISVWTIHGDTEETLRKVLKRYEENNPNIVFDITVYKNEIYQTAINNVLVNNSLPDMFFWWGFSKLERLVDAGMIYDISLALDKKQIKSEITDGGLDAFTFNNRTYALPLYGWTAALFCNRQIFEQNGLEYPKNYSHFLNTIEKLQDNKFTPLITSAKEGWVSSLYYMSLVQGGGSGKNIIEAVNNRSLFLSPQYSDAAHNLHDLVVQKTWQNNYLESDAYNAAYSFTQGEGAMLYYGSWATTMIEGENSKVSDIVDVIPFPNENMTEGIGGFVDTFVINKDGIIPKNSDYIEMYIDIMHETSDIIVNEIGGGIPVYRDQSIDIQKFPLLHAVWEINKNRTLYPAYDQIMSEDLSGRYYSLLNELMAGEIDDVVFIEGLSAPE